MHPPFFVVDHRVGPENNSSPARATTRRSQPARLPLPYVADGIAQPPFLPPVQAAVPVARLHFVLVPPPRPTLRDRLGRLLIRVGQRLIFENRARGV